MHNGRMIARALAIETAALAANGPAQADIAPYPRGAAGQVTLATLIIVVVVIGAVAGWLAGMRMRSGGFGRVGDLIAGILGGLLGGFIGAMVFGTLGNQFAGLIAMFVCAAVGGIILVVLSRAIKRA
jgi:uncharacterized membrane protein YeaQ/YmgE (transglycosylase-associated protein family)